MANVALVTAQLEALKAAWRWSPAGRKHAQLDAVAKGPTGARKAQARRFARSGRAYLSPDVVLPLGCPKPDAIREAKKRPVGNPLLWESNAPASGCRELRKPVSFRRPPREEFTGLPEWDGPTRQYFADTTK